MDIIGIPSDDFPELASSMSWHFESFADRSGGEATVNDLTTDVMNGIRQCWMAWDGKVRACGLTQVSTGHVKVVEFTHCAGDGRGDWAEKLVSEIEEWARSIGACKFRIINRPGHTKMLKGMGFTETHRVLERNLV